MVESTHGLYREVELYDNIVKKYPRFEEAEDALDYRSTYNFDMIMGCQKNELGFWKEFGNNSALCPILPGSNSDCIYMQRAITVADYAIKDLQPESSLDPQERIRINLAVEDPGMSYDVTYLISLGKALAKLAGVKLLWSNFIDGLNEIYRHNRKAYEGLMADIHGDNIGILNDELVIIDYGCVEPIY